MKIEKRPSKEKIILCKEIYRVGQEVLEKIERAGIKDIILVCADPTNTSLKGEDMKEG